MPIVWTLKDEEYRKKDEELKLNSENQEINA